MASARPSSTYYAESLEESSIGDVSTLRTKLQSRRAQLNVEIEKEDKFHQGSKRLVRASSDHKARDQAQLEASFAESKIRVHQAELAKINSSLQAYQQEGLRSSQPPLIPFALKTTARLSVVSSFTDTISGHYHMDPAALLDQIYEFQELRYAVSNVTRDESGVESLLEYHNQLQLVSKRLIHPKLRHGLAFIWYDAINGLPAVQQSVTFEKACIIFNIAALHSQMAAQEDRSTVAGASRAVASLEKGIGALEYMKDRFSNSPTLDMSDELLSFLSDLLRAQAQEVRWEREQLEMKRTEPSTIIDAAHKTKSVAECYSPLKELVEDNSMKGYLPECWISYVKVKEAHYKALAHYYAALAHDHLASACKGEEVVGEEVRMELKFLYAVDSEEAQDAITASNQQYHVGLAKAHLNCAVLAHEYALKYNSYSRDLSDIKPLCQMLQDAAARTRAKKEEMSEEEGASIMAPAIKPSEITLKPVFPEFSSVEVEDLFRSLGPLPAFSAENSWSTPRVLTIHRGKGGLGLSLRGSRPSSVSAVEDGSPAEDMGVCVGDWVLAVDGRDVRYKSHNDAIAIVTDCGDEVTFELVTPT
ncbi:Rhophilin-2 [Geodia barretti]|uniref:Rhophilin-2 n=2 Tax=Geodia barretti TaxID=519541 RepID=A0AA35WD59_GEOBA|nr:Rhophilin-2 [Geodia barretti]